MYLLTWNSGSLKCAIKKWPSLDLMLIWYAWLPCWYGKRVRCEFSASTEWCCTNSHSNFKFLKSYHIVSYIHTTYNYFRIAQSVLLNQSYLERCLKRIHQLLPSLSSCYTTKSKSTTLMTFSMQPPSTNQSSRVFLPWPQNLAGWTKLLKVLVD